MLTGVGFLGAGVIIREEGGQTIKGLTTSASIWVVACLGMACGAGRWPAVAVAFGITHALLVFGVPVEVAIHHRLFPQDGEERTASETGGS